MEQKRRVGQRWQRAHPTGCAGAQPSPLYPRPHTHRTRAHLPLAGKACLLASQDFLFIYFTYGDDLWRCRYVGVRVRTAVCGKRSAAAAERSAVASRARCRAQQIVLKKVRARPPRLCEVVCSVHDSKVSH